MPIPYVVARSMRGQKQTPVALTVAGSDSGGGAGIQADLKTFAALGVHGVSAITCITAQNPNGVRGIQPASPEIVRSQIEAVLEAFFPHAAKTGMLYSTRLLRMVAAVFKCRPCPALVVDPVMVATSGARLLQNSAVRALERELLPLATLTTPNVDEAEILAGFPVRDVEDLRRAARTIQGRFGCAVLAKGGHLRGLREAADIFTDGKTELLFTAPLVRGVSTHGTGCTYSAAIAAWLARGCSLVQAVTRAKEYIASAIGTSIRAGRHDVLGFGFLRSTPSSETTGSKRPGPRAETRRIRRPLPSLRSPVQFRGGGQSATTVPTHPFGRTGRS